MKKEEGGRHKPFVSNYTPQMYVRTGDVASTINLDDGKEFVMPGEDANFNLTLHQLVSFCHPGFPVKGLNIC